MIVSKGGKRISKMKFLKMADGLAIMPVKMSIICRILSLTSAQDFAIKITPIFAEKLAHSLCPLVHDLAKKIIF